MSQEYKPPLAAHFVWHPKDSDFVEPILESARRYFTRDADRPFSRELNIPLFFYSSDISTAIPEGRPSSLAKRDVVFVFTSTNTSGRPIWSNYINEIDTSNGVEVVPIAINEHGLRPTSAIEGVLAGRNAIRAYDYDEKHRLDYIIIALAHELYRHGLVEINEKITGKSSSIKIFISHTKVDSDKIGTTIAKEIKRFIDDTNMRRFFDSTDISPGFQFPDEITMAIQESTLVAICSDAYSSRHWCQKEILYGKEYNRPMVAVNCLKDYEDRIFPDVANVPCVRIPADLPVEKTSLLSILRTALLETIRHKHSLELLTFYQEQEWIDSDCSLFARPPEARRILIHTESKWPKKICYPEPPLYCEESKWLNNLGIEAFTPLLKYSDNQLFIDKKIGISISDFPDEGYSKHHLHTNQLKRLSQDLARHMLARAAIIVYGGDLRPDGFTQFILDEAQALKSRLQTEAIFIENHLAWPLHLNDDDLTIFRANYSYVLEIMEHPLPDQFKLTVDENIFLEPNSSENWYIWSRSLTEMRTKSIESCDARICAGGKLTGYKGNMPGVLEEICLALKMEKPIFLLGRFGGVVGEVCKSIQDKNVTLPLTDTWQYGNNKGYEELQKRALDKCHGADYAGIATQLLDGILLTELANRVGLSENEYERIMVSPFADECIHLILKGLKNIFCKKGK